MKVISAVGPNDKHRFKNAVVAIGVFDGVHRGHQKLITQAIRRAKSVKGQTVIMTFWPHPVHVLHPEVKLPLLVSLDYRLKLFTNFGVDVCVVVTFTKSFSRLSPNQFIERYLVSSLKPKEIFVGDDFRFGQNRSGTIDYFKAAGKQYGFKVHNVHPLKGGQEKISSTDIRDLIAQGQLDQAKKLLGRPVSIMGTVVKGDSRGKTLGFPTANLCPQDIVIPPLGVYAVRVLIDDQVYYGAANIGRRPSFKRKNQPINFEVHIFNFKANLYGRKIIVEFFKKIRDEKTFNSKEKLIQQIKIDAGVAKAIFSSI